MSDTYIITLFYTQILFGYFICILCIRDLCVRDLSSQCEYYMIIREIYILIDNIVFNNILNHV